jgi:uncharacterized protein (DUF302 family)
MVGGMYERLPVNAKPKVVVTALRDVLRERGVTEYAVVDHGHDMAAAGQPAYPAWTLIFGNPAAGARLLARDLATAVDIPLRLAVIGRGDASEIVLRDMRTLIDVDIARRVHRCSARARRSDSRAHLAALGPAASA